MLSRSASPNSQFVELAICRYEIPDFLHFDCKLLTPRNLGCRCCKYQRRRYDRTQRIFEHQGLCGPKERGIWTSCQLVSNVLGTRTLRSHLCWRSTQNNWNCWIDDWRRHIILQFKVWFCNGQRTCVRHCHGEWKVVTATAKQNSDLFWAVKGGGNNFGIVTKLHSPPTRLL